MKDSGTCVGLFWGTNPSGKFANHTNENNENMIKMWGSGGLNDPNDAKCPKNKGGCSL